MFQSEQQTRTFKGDIPNHRRSSEDLKINYAEMADGYAESLSLDIQPAQMMAKEEEFKQGESPQMKEEVKQGKFPEEGGGRGQSMGINYLEMADGYAESLSLGMPPAQMMVREEEEKPKQGKMVQAKQEEEEEPKQEKPMQAREEEVQAQKGNGNNGQPNAPSGIRAHMPEGVQAKMENSFGTRFANVNLYQNDNSATGMGALAYTQGNNVHFAPGQYSPNSQVGPELLGHELAHVVQQRQGRVQPTAQRKGSSINNSPALEKEADVMGARAAQGKDADGITGKGSSPGAQLKVDPDTLVKAKESVDEMQEFVSRLYTSYLNRLGIVEGLLKLENTDLTHTLFTRMVSEAFEGIEAFGGVWAIVAEPLKVGWDAYKKVSGGKASNKVSYQFMELADDLEDLFDKTFVALEQEEADLELDDSKANLYATHPFTPSHHAKAMEISDRYEIKIWKHVLPIKWKHVYCTHDYLYGDEPDFSNFHELHPNNWKEVAPNGNGYRVVEHWLASGGGVFASKADQMIGERLFEHLHVPRQEVYNHWNLTKVPYKMPNPV